MFDYVTKDTYYEVHKKDLLKNVYSHDLIELRSRCVQYKITKTIKGNYLCETKEYLVANLTET